MDKTEKGEVTEKGELTENEKKKEFLNSYQEEKEAVKRLEEQLEELRVNKLSPSYMIGDGMPHGNTLTDLSNYAAQIEELEDEILSARDRRIDAFQKVQRAIETMDGSEKEKSVLTYRYLKGWEWERIAVEMRCTYRHVTRLHGSALENFKMS